MSRSSLENSGYQSSYSLHIRCSDRLWTGDNSCQVALNANSLAAGQTATLRFKARWLRGWPEVLLRLNGNWLEATGGDARAHQPRHAGRTQQPICDQCGAGHLQRHPYIRRCRPPISRWW